MKMRPPATPIINIDPYFSVWAEESVLNNTVHCTGKPNTIRGRAFVDGEEYHFLGDKGGKPDMEIENISVDAHSTVITYKNNAIRLVAHFTSPTLVEDLYYASRPVAYCKVSYESLDGLAHEVKVKFSVSEELVLNKRGEGRAYSQPVKVEGVSAQRMGKGEIFLSGR